MRTHKESAVARISFEWRSGLTAGITDATLLLADISYISEAKSL
jgi:hypothetical protein